MFWGSGGGDLAHGVVKGQSEDLDEEVNGVAGQVTLGPAPVAVFDDEAGIGGQEVIAGGLFDELEGALLEQRDQGCQAGGADLAIFPDIKGRVSLS